MSEEPKAFAKTPTIYTLENLFRTARGAPAASRDGKVWYPARPEGGWFRGWRLKAAWLVFTGRADAVIWPGGQ
jgi:hypothetical protein